MPQKKDNATSELLMHKPFFGPFKIDELTSPYVDSSQFIFYAYDEFHNAPYKLTCAYPYKKNSGDVTYSLLGFCG